MESKQFNAVMQDMVNWLSDEHELGKVPYRIECTNEFVFNDMHYYIFKYKATVFGKWLIGVSGGFEDEDIEPCGHTFSEMHPYCEDTAQGDCIAMIEMIMAYYKDLAMKYSNNSY